ncbi:hypothetical protein DHL47_05515 [Streptococcus panodentis]|uniref:Uncharacterized protein n=3 Tax=Streptococcus TaxID=1301 RepID=A0ABS5AW56_9STRE|nr:hypothetical protein [Streptococcus panodentis]
MIHTSAYILLVLTVLYAGFVIKSYISSKSKELRLVAFEEEQRKDPLYDETSMIQKLTDIQETIDEPEYIDYTKRILKQLLAAKTLSDDFVEIVENNDQPIIQNIAKELVSIRVHILQDAKSIYRRLIIAKDGANIETKLIHNDKLLDDADSLIVEAINYIDVKTSTSEIDLKNLTDSLKELIKLI